MGTNRTMTDHLGKIDHIVVLMMENRSFDHLLGYLRLDDVLPGVDGLTGQESNDHGGTRYPVTPLPSTRFYPDPCHTWECTEDQLQDGNGGFVRSFAALDPQTPGRIMGYHRAGDLPVYDALAREYCVCDQWFASVPGPTWPNRLYALAGNSQGERNNPSLFPFPAYPMKTIFEHLDDAGVDWRYYSHDIAFLRVFAKYRYYTARIQPFGSFERAARDGRLPPVTWIDPNFGDVGFDGNDDHPPVDLRRGQALVRRVYQAVATAGQGLWGSTLLVITYDEHGGFFDHVAPGVAADDVPAFQRYGVRVPALVMSPWVEPGVPSHIRFDHTSVLKTILVRFCQRGGVLPDMGARVQAANDLGPLLSRETPRLEPLRLPRMAVRKPTTEALRREGIPEAALLQPTELQRLLQELKRECVAAGLPPSRL
jgi:phospholipase C